MIQNQRFMPILWDYFDFRSRYKTYTPICVKIASRSRNDSANRYAVTLSFPSHSINTTFGVGEDTEPSEVYL